MLLQLVLVYALSMGNGLEAPLAAMHANNPLAFHAMRLLHPQEVRDAWVRLVRQRDADRLNDGDSSLPPLGVIGRVEPVYVEEIPIAFPARIDTGASLCSLDASDIKHFERDGRPWVSFTIKNREDDTSHTFERRERRNVLIKQHGREAIRRPMVMMRVRLGDTTLRREFTLTNRHNFRYQVLVGRNLLRGIALVDVAAVNTLQ